MRNDTETGTGSGTGTETGTVAERLAGLALSIRARGLDAGESHAAARAVVDWFSATIPGSAMPPAQILTEALLDSEEEGPARLVATGRRAPVRTAALVNAVASHTAELDDIYRDGIYHPGSPTVAAALALGERLDASGADLLRAVAVGYEIGDRVSAAVNPAHYRFWHTTGTIGTLGAACAAADLLGLDRTAFAHAVATATTMAAGLQQAFRSDAMSKPLHAGHAAEAGLLAALAAGRGYTGALDVLEGAAGFGAGLAGSPDWSAAVADPGRALLIGEATVKNHACCGHTFAAVDGALQLRGEGLDPRDVAAIEVRTYTTATRVAGNAEPRTEFEAKFSTSYCVAAALRLGSVRLRAFEPSSLGDPGIRDLARRITVVADDAMEQAFPRQRQATVTVKLADGTTRSAHRSTRKGDPDDPLTDAELTEKFTELSTPVLGPGRTARLADALWNAAGAKTLSELPIGGEEAR
jgi:2-methylcitrate dehydratase PrpD